MAAALPLNQIFKANFSIQVNQEISRSKSLIEGNFQVSSYYYVNKYLIAHSMFQNPNICRKYAKEIAKILDDVTPSVLVSYSTTGVILYWYLKYHYFKNLDISIVSGPGDVRHEFGRKPTANDKILVVTDVMLTGNFMSDIRKYLEACNCPPETIVLEVAIFKLGGIENENTRHTVILHNISNVVITEAKSSGKINSDRGLSYSSVSSPESSSLLPTVYDQMQSTIDNLRNKKELLRTFMPQLSSSDFQHYPSRIDNENMSKFELETYWRGIQDAFQMGHIERAHTHFDIYDIPERLLSNKLTARQIECVFR